MTAKITKIFKRPSYRGGNMFYIFFKSLDNNGNSKSYRTCLASEFGNFQRWQPIIQRYQKGEEIILDNLFLKTKELVDADSNFNLVQSIAEKKG